MFLKMLHLQHYPNYHTTELSLSFCKFSFKQHFLTLVTSSGHTEIEEFFVLFLCYSQNAVDKKSLATITFISLNCFPFIVLAVTVYNLIL